MEDLKYFCSHLFTSFSFDHTGKARVCCNNYEIPKDEDGKPINVYSDDFKITDAFNSDLHIRIRQNILKNEQDDILRIFIDLLIFLQTRFCVRPNSSTFSGFAVNWKNFKGGARWNDPDLKKDPRRNRWDGSNYKKYQTLDMETFQDNRIVTEILIDEVMEK